MALPHFHWYYLLKLNKMHKLSVMTKTLFISGRPKDIFESIDLPPKLISQRGELNRKSNDHHD